MSTSAFTSLVGLQLLTRAVNFVLTTALARRLGPAAIGLANVNLQLVSASALFLAKEGVRRAGQRVYPGGVGAPLAHGTNLVWLSVPLTALCAAAVGLSTAHRGLGSSEADAPVSADEYAVTVWLFCFAAVLEACTEPPWLYAQANALIPTRVAAEGGALLLKAFATGYLVMAAGGAAGAARAFGMAQLLYSAAYLALLLALLHRQTGGRIVTLLMPRKAVPLETAATGRPSAAPGTPHDARAVWLPRAHRASSMQYCWAAVQKYALTEGSAWSCHVACPPHPTSLGATWQVRPHRGGASGPRLDGVPPRPGGI